MAVNHLDGLSALEYENIIVSVTIILAGRKTQSDNQCSTCSLLHLKQSFHYFTHYYSSCGAFRFGSLTREICLLESTDLVHRRCFDLECLLCRFKNQVSKFIAKVWLHCHLKKAYISSSWKCLRSKIRRSSVAAMLRIMIPLIIPWVDPNGP